MNALPIGVRKAVAWMIIVAAWATLLPFGVFCALALPLNLFLVPCFIAAATSLGRLPAVLLDTIPAHKIEEERAPASALVPRRA